MALSLGVVSAERRRMKIITIVPHHCTGCRLCEIACSLKNAGECNPAKSKIRVIDFDNMFPIPLMCLQCEKPFCAEICPSGAIIKEEETGVVKVSKEKCVGCKMCTLACPFGSIAFSTEDRIVVKCDFCNGEPECVTFCPTGALEFREVDTAVIRKKINLREKLRAIYEGTIGS